MDKKYVIIVGVVIILVGVGAFYSGVIYNQNKSVSDGQQRFGQAAGANIGGQFGFRGGQGRAGGGFISGDVISKDSQSLTIKMRDGSSKIVFFSDTTEVSKFVAGTSMDLAVGKTVVIMGKPNSDGSITATTIQLRPNMPTSNPTK